MWRGGCSSAELIIRPIRPEDETTKKDATKVVLSLLLMFGIVETCSEDTDLENDLSKIQLSERDQYRFLILVGDGLSQIRVKSFNQMLNESTYSLDQEETCYTTFEKAMQQVINLTGNLHGGCFHFLAAVYNLFYGSHL